MVEGIINLPKYSEEKIWELTGAAGGIERIILAMKKSEIIKERNVKDLNIYSLMTLQKWQTWLKDWLRF